MLRNVLFNTFLFFLTASSFAQVEKVQFKVRNVAPLRTFQYQQPSQFEIVNGNLHAALASGNDYLFEINYIPAKLIWCKKRLSQKQFQAVLIDNRTERTYSSNAELNGTLQIRCMNSGKLKLIFTGTLVYEKQKVIVNATLLGEVAHSKNLKTQ